MYSGIYTEDTARTSWSTTGLNSCTKMYAPGMQDTWPCSIWRTCSFIWFSLVYHEMRKEPLWSMHLPWVGFARTASATSRLSVCDCRRPASSRHEVKATHIIFEHCNYHQSRVWQIDGERQEAGGWTLSRVAPIRPTAGCFNPSSSSFHRRCVSRTANIHHCSRWFTRHRSRYRAA